MSLIPTTVSALGLLVLAAGCAATAREREPLEHGALSLEHQATAALAEPVNHEAPELQPVSFDVVGPSLTEATEPAVGPPLAAADRHNTERSILTADDSLTAPLTEVPVPAAPVSDAMTLNLASALSMAGGQNPQIAFAAARYREAYARLEAARVLWLPSIRAGVSYHHHDGNLQDVAGQIVNLSRSSLQSGMGVGSVGAGSTPVPGVVMQFHTSDAVFQPRIESYTASAERAGTRTATNDTLLEAALAYLELLRAYQDLRIRQQTQDDVQQLAKITQAYAETGQGLRADADRVLTELMRRRNEVSRAEEAIDVATAQLAQVLSTDPTLSIVPQEPTVVPIDLVADGVPVQEFVATALSNRPELAEAQYLVCEAVQRYRRERYAPLLPSVLLGISQTGFGGGIGSDIERFDDRFDFDAMAFWELRNLGVGELARRDQTRASYDRARAVHAQRLDRVAREVVEAHAQVTARRSQITTAEEGIEAATLSYRRNLERIQQGQGLPIEVLQSIQALDEARREYLRSVVDYNASEFRLQRALGWPIG